MTSYTGTRAVVLGADGFIGRWVARHLQRARARVVGFVKDQDVARWVLGSEIDLCEVDLEVPDRLETALSAQAPAVVFNLAGYGVARSERDLPRMQGLNAALPRRLVEALSGTGARLVHVGSGAEYGPVAGSLDEDGPCAPDTDYGRAKLAGTEGLRAAARRLGVAAIVARIFTVYGPGEHPGRLLPTLLEAVGSADQIRLSEGLQKRDFTYVEDVAEGLLRLGVAEFEPGTVVNLGRGVLVTVRSFVQEAAAVLGIAPERLAFGAVPSGPYEMENDPVSLNRLRALIGWTPSTGVGDGVRRTRDGADR